MDNNNLVGMKFGRLTVIEDTGKRSKTREIKWYCKCECGGDCEVVTSSLKRGHTQSCGNCKRNEIIGERFGHLVVLDAFTFKNHKGKWLTYCWCTCDCGCEYAITMDKLKSNRNPNISCGCQTKKQRIKNNVRNYEDITGQRFGSLVVTKCIFEMGEKSVCECVCDCGNTHTVVKSELVYGNVLSCGCSKFSSYENKTEEMLKDLCVEYETQKRFPDCKYKYTLPFDFYLPKYNVCIEVDGQGHFEPIEAFRGQEGYEDTIRTDNIKNQYCIDNNIDLLRIPYWDYKDNEIVIGKIKKAINNNIIKNP